MNTVDDLKTLLKGLGAEWASEYGDLLRGSATDLAAFYGQVASAAAASTIEGDEDALRMLKLASYSILLTHRIRVERKNREVWERGVGLLINAVRVVATAATTSIAGEVSDLVDSLVEEAN
jgi:hypothetical protein